MILFHTLTVSAVSFTGDLRSHFYFASRQTASCWQVSGRLVWADPPHFSKCWPSSGYQAPVSPPSLLHFVSSLGVLVLILFLIGVNNTAKNNNYGLLLPRSSNISLNWSLKETKSSSSLNWEFLPFKSSEVCLLKSASESMGREKCWFCFIWGILIGYLEKAEDDDSFFFTGLIGYREKVEDDDSFLLTGLAGYLDEEPWLLAGFLSGRVWTGTLFWNCWG